VGPAGQRRGDREAQRWSERGCGVGRYVGGRGGGLSPGEEVGRAREGKESWAAGLG